MHSHVATHSRKDDVRIADDVTRTEFSDYMKAFEERLKQREERLMQRMDVQFDETRSLIRLSLEAVDSLRETTASGFNEVRQQLDEQSDLLKTAVRHVRRRVETLERNRG